VIHRLRCNVDEAMYVRRRILAIKGSRHRRVLAGALLAAMFVAGDALAASPSAPEPLCFRALRDGDEIGLHRIAFRADGDNLVAEIAIDFEVSFGPIRLFHYRHRNREVWHDGRLVAIATRTDDNGTLHAVNGRASENGFVVTGSAGRLRLPADVMPTSYWHSAGERRTTWLDTQNGTALSVTARPADPLPGSARSIALSGDLSLTAGYDRSGRWSGLRFSARGSTIEYKPCDSPVEARWRFSLDDVPAPAMRRTDATDTQ
jgi:hypothetical protein